MEEAPQVQTKTPPNDFLRCSKNVAEVTTLRRVGMESPRHLGKNHCMNQLPKGRVVDIESGASWRQEGSGNGLSKTIRGKRLISLVMEAYGLIHPSLQCTCYGLFRCAVRKIRLVSLPMGGDRRTFATHITCTTAPQPE